ncbi:hypothetical protein GCM10028773_04020 [Spirosoma koreense]
MHVGSHNNTRTTLVRYQKNLKICNDVHFKITNNDLKNEKNWLKLKTTNFKLSSNILNPQNFQLNE